VCIDAATVRTFGEVRRSGMSRTAVREAVTSGALVRLRHGVYADAGCCAVVRDAATHGGAIACITAARHLGLWVLSSSTATHVTVGGHGHRHLHDDCRCTEHWDEPPRDDGSVRGLFTPLMVRSVLRQILACCGAEEFFVALESALHQEVLDAADLDWLRAHCPRAATEAIELARSDADSGLESLLRWRLRRFGLPIRTQLSLISVGRVDLLIGDRLIVEADGVENHDGESHRHKDLVRDANAAMWGYVTLRFDYALIVHDWDAVERAILASVARGLHLADR
jgi:very-short-patch-repair endonuclease